MDKICILGQGSDMMIDFISFICDVLYIERVTDLHETKSVEGGVDGRHG